ncbi:MAG: hypothetical protein JSC189_000280 [Candidatus Tokpelaia sp. JSC189]|nr:MAG: hypothetical protein JSC189_000280 [Candidatus Tokpelaia sp. JSC189]
MIQDRIRYEVLVQDALRNVIRKMLADVVKTGLPGEHHFLITFLTNAAGVEISSRLKERYPEQMTIVLQHQFWDLQVKDDYFQVKLSFNNIPEKLIIPFSAMLIFYDPTVAFEAVFDILESAEHIGQFNETVTIDGSEPQSIRASNENRQHINNIERIVDLNKPLANIVSLDAFRKNK